MKQLALKQEFELTKLANDAAQTAKKDELESCEEVDYEQLATVKSELAKNAEELSAIPEDHLHTVVTFEDISKVIELWTGIPASKIQENDLKKLINLTDVLKSKVIGQDEAIDVISSAVRRSRVQINNKRRPASFIFVGPTGVGKTELVKVLANELFDTPETLIRLDMSEFMEKHSVSRIIGSPPGYVGYDEAGQLTEKVRRKPYSVVLFDEIEKAHPDVLNILLQILDDGRVTDAHGRVVNFENTIIVMTSNAGSEKREGSLGFGKTAESMAKDKAIKALEEILRPEFLGRVDEIAVFKPLELESLEKIADLMLEDIKEPLEKRGIDLSYSNDVETILGPAGRVAISNKEALESLTWDDGALESLVDARNWVTEIPEYPGSYYVQRAIYQAYWNVVSNGKNTKDMMMKFGAEANDEIARKWKQYTNRG